MADVKFDFILKDYSDLFQSKFRLYWTDYIKLDGKYYD